MRKPVYKLLVINFIAFFLVSGPVFAQGIDPNNYGQNHSYQVLLRENGESIVTLSVDSVNTSDKPVSEIVFKAPSAKITDFKAWQYTDTRKCYEQITNKEVSVDLCKYAGSQYTIVSAAAFGGAVVSKSGNFYPKDELKDRYYYRYTQSYTTSTQCYSRSNNIVTDRSFCETQEQDYQVYVYPFYWNPSTGYYIVNGSAGWEKAVVTNVGDDIKISLLNPVSKNSKVVLSLRYRAGGYVKKGLFGSRNFDFKTLEATDEIKSANVTVYADADLFFKGKKSNVGSGTIDQMMSAPKATGMEMAQTSLGLSSGYAAYDYYGPRDTGKSAPFSRSAQYLAVGEKLTVSGTYATSWFGYYYKHIFAVLLGLAAVIIGWFFFQRWYTKWQEKHGVKAVTNEAGTKSPFTFITMNWVWGFLGAAFFMGALILIFTLYDNMPSSYRYSHGPFVIMYPISILVSFLVSAGLFLGAPLYVGTKKASRTQGLTVFGYELMFLFLANIIYFYFSN